MGGDGIIHGAMNGIMERDDAKAIAQSLKLGVVGCGSWNSFATSLTYASNEMYGARTETFLITRGQTTPVDIS